jgi:hypothetical protein
LDEPIVANSSVTIGRPGQFKAFEEHCVKRLQAAALAATKRAAR